MTAAEVLEGDRRAVVTELCSCGALAHRTIAAVAYCDICADELLDPIRARVLADESGVGIGRQRGPLRPDYGHRWAELACTVCDATWTGRIGTPCAYCEHRAVRLVELQRRRILRPELPTVADRHRSDALDAWYGRLARAVRAGIISEHDADDACARWAG